MCVCLVQGGRTREAVSANVYTLNLPAVCEDHILTMWGQREREEQDGKIDGMGGKEERQIIGKQE